MAFQIIGKLTVCSRACLGYWWRKIKLCKSSALLAIDEGNPLVNSGFPSQRDITLESISISIVDSPHKRSVILWHGEYSLWLAWYTPHSSPERLRYGVSFVKPKFDNWSLQRCMQYQIILDQVIKGLTVFLSAVGFKVRCIESKSSFLITLSDLSKHNSLHMRVRWYGVSFVSSESDLCSHLLSNLNINCTKYQNLTVSRLILQLSLRNLLKPGVQARMKM